MARAASKTTTKPSDYVWVLMEHTPSFFGLKVSSHPYAVASDQEYLLELKASIKELYPDSKRIYTTHQFFLQKPIKKRATKSDDFISKTATGSGAVSFATTKSGNLAAKKPRAKRSKA